MTTMPISLFIIDPDPQATVGLRSGFATAGLRLVGADDTIERAMPTVKAMSPDAIVLDIAGCTDLSSGVRMLQLACPGVCVIVTGAGTSPIVMSRAVASGARGFLIKPYRAEDLFTNIREAVDVSRARAETKAPRGPAEHQRGRLLAVYSPKGGVGCTTIATNLAVALSARPKTSVALIDLDLQFGDVGAALDLHSVNTVAELLKADEIGPDLINEAFVRHESGVRALLAPDDLDIVDTIETEQVLRLLDQLRPHFDFIVCDLWSGLDQLTRNVMRVADRVLLVTTPEFPAIRDLQRVLKSTRVDLGLDGRMLVVVNRFPGKAGLPITEIAKALGHEVAATIPSEGITVTDAINRGLSLLDSRAKVRLARHYHSLAALTAAGAGREIGSAARSPAPAELTR
jgi:pilus assembly protein CpaE